MAGGSAVNKTEYGTGAILEALRASVGKTRRYFTVSLIFYAFIIAFLAFLALTAKEAKARNAYVGFIILSYLGFNGLWISALRGLKGTRLTPGGFLNLFRFPLAAGIMELENASGWGSEEERWLRARELLQRQAAAEREHRAWPNRALSLAVITVIDLVIWLVWHNPVMALVNQVVATVISQVHISLGPRASMETWEELNARVAQSSSQAPDPRTSSRLPF